MNILGIEPKANGLKVQCSTTELHVPFLKREIEKKRKNISKRGLEPLPSFRLEPKPNVSTNFTTSIFKSYSTLKTSNQYPKTRAFYNAQIKNKKK